MYVVCGDGGGREGLELWTEGVCGISDVLSAGGEKVNEMVDEKNDDENDEDEDQQVFEEEAEQDGWISPQKGKNRKNKPRSSSKKFPKKSNFTPKKTYTGRCVYWSPKGYGFLHVPSFGRVFVHNLALPHTSKFRRLKKGEECIFEVVDSEKGWRADNVRGVDGGILECE